MEFCLGLLVVMLLASFIRNKEIQKVEIYEDDINPHVEVIDGALWWKGK